MLLIGASLCIIFENTLQNVLSQMMQRSHGHSCDHVTVCSLKCFQREACHKVEMLLIGVGDKPAEDGQ